MHSVLALVLVGSMVDAAVLGPRQGWWWQAQKSEGLEPGSDGPFGDQAGWAGSQPQPVATPNGQSLESAPPLWPGPPGSWNPSPTASPTASSPPSSKPTASSTPTPTLPSDGSNPAYMAIVGKWRSKLSLSPLTWSPKLQDNALKTVDDSRGQMVHELNPGSMAQVLAPGDADSFEKVFVGGWLCEKPNTPGLDGICATMSQGWAYDGQTGHAEILISPAYHNIGCALAYGIWACDLQ